MNIQVEGITYPITSEDIDNFQKKYELRLPQDYVEFLLKHNGGTPKLSRFITKDEKVTSHFKFIMPLVKEAKNSEVKHNLDYCYFKFIIIKKMMEYMFPFGETPTENILCMSLRDDNYGAVYYWDRELEVIYKQPRSECYHKIADSFKAFLEGLQPRE